MSLRDTITRSFKHSTLEDVQAIVTGTLFVALGVALFKQVGMLTGGTVGIAFLLHYAIGLPFGLLFFCINLPFYWLAYKRMGLPFTLKTITAVSLMAVLAEVLPRWLQFAELNPWFGAIAGGLLIGAGMLILFRHRASLGGLNVVVLYLQEKYGWRAGYVQAGLDLVILLCGLAYVPPERVGLSLLGMLAINAALAINHRPGRYMAV
ncbi:YitT family protein [Roseateles oligotrophus]|uniref:YitT family protein n=1 Tax=Roseateles oligotrophus TaxID=1769250 RepID=A0ABT2YB50_9BURK|nr:YitT family protein [Roseateles oligotrophus]MCV2367537.1 YitT family protein [Roseateles oligotrophus]